MRTIALFIKGRNKVYLHGRSKQENVSGHFYLFLNVGSKLLKKKLNRILKYDQTKKNSNMTFFSTHKHSSFYFPDQEFRIETLRLSQIKRILITCWQQRRKHISRLGLEGHLSKRHSNSPRKRLLIQDLRKMKNSRFAFMSHPKFSNKSSYFMASITAFRRIAAEQYIFLKLNQY